MAGIKLSFLPYLLVILFNMSLILGSLEAQMIVGYYSSTCKVAELIVKNEVRNAVIKDMGIAAGLLRLHFHDCFVRGCDGSVLIDSTPTNEAEKEASANGITLRGMEVIDSIKDRLESLCPGVVSCADILAFAARDSVEATGGIGYQVPAGRKDGRISLASDAVDLPSPSSSVSQLTQLFAKKGLTQEEMITLLGAHSIGQSHCNSFESRLYNFSSTTAQDPSLDPVYAEMLKQQCQQDSNGNNLVVVPMDPASPNMMDTAYYYNVLTSKGLFVSDQAMLSDPATSVEMLQNANNALQWKLKFASAMVKMGQIGVLTGDDGEIRSNCRVIN